MLGGIFDNYSRIINSRINGLLHASCEVEVESVEEQRYFEFSNALMEGAVVTLANLVLKGRQDDTPILFHTTTPVMLSMMDRMLGGEGEVEDDLPSDYTYTDLDLQLYENLMQGFISLMSRSWENYIQLEFEYGRIEANPSLLQVIGLDEPVVLVDLKIAFPNCEGSMSICLPGMMLTNIFAEINRDNPIKNASAEDSSESIFDHIRTSSLEVVAQLGQTNLRLGDIYSLNVGDIIDLNQEKDSKIDLHIGERRWFSGRMGVHNKNVAVKIDSIYHNAEGRGNQQDEQ